MSDPFKILPPAVVSFSGGRTSGRMLWGILEAHGGKLPDGILVAFLNTGKERVETLDFVERCSVEWGAEIVWLEYRRDAAKEIGGKGRNGQPSISRHSWAEVDYASASRDGRPFNELLEVMSEFRREVKGRDPVLPNPVQRFCTGEMKIRTLGRYLISLGWDLEDVTDAVGLRADEPRRVAKLNAKRDSATQVMQCGNPVAPLAAAGITEADVMAFWSKQPFDLGLKQHEGNCDLCFLKSAGKRQVIMRDRPDLARWWIDAEEKSGQRFRKDGPSFRMQLEMSRQADLFDTPDDADVLSASCHCTD